MYTFHEENNACVMGYDLYEYDLAEVQPLEDRIAALEKLKGLDGHNIELAKRIFPDGAPPDDPNSYAIMWRLVARKDEQPYPWNLLVFMSELKGARGEEGAPGKDGVPGKDGSGVLVSGVVTTTSDLYHLSNVTVGSFYVVADIQHLFAYKGGTVSHTSSWVDMGKVAAVKGEKGDKGDRGARGPEGAQGPSGASVSSFLVQWMVNTATSSAISGVMMEVNNTINDAIETMANQLANLAEDAAQSAVEKVMDDMMDEFKGDKGEKGDQGDKGDDGKDGKSVRLVGKYELLSTFMTRYPAIESNVGVAALIGKDGEEKILWAITETPSIGGLPAHYSYEELGDILGPKGDKGADADWNVSIRDRHFVEKMAIEVTSDLPEGVAGMYIQESNSISIEPTSGSPVSPNQVGFSLHMKYPIPTLVPEGGLSRPTVDKFLTNDGEKLEWVDIDLSTDPQEALYIKAPNDTVFKITVTNDGRLEVTEDK